MCQMFFYTAFLVEMLKTIFSHQNVSLSDVLHRAKLEGKVLSHEEKICD